MTTRLYFIFFILLTACNSQLTENAIDSIALDSSTTISHLQLTTDSTVVKDTLQLNSKFYIQITKDNRFSYLLSMHGDTIIPAEDYYFQIKTLDVNEDGYTDIRIYLNVEANNSEDYFFDKRIRSFRKVDMKNPDIKKLAGTNLYYSYNHVGCGDNSWESHLSKIDNWTEIDIGWMDVHGCGNKEDGIKIYRTTGNSKH